MLRLLPGISSLLISILQLHSHAYFPKHFTGFSSVLSHLIYPITARVVGAPKMISQPVSSIFSPVLHCPLGLGELQACPFPDVIFPQPSSVYLVFFPLSLRIARWFWPDLMSRRHDHCNLRLFTMVRRSSCGPTACRIFARTSSCSTLR